MLDVIHKGIDWRQTLTVVDAAGDAEDLTGLTIVLELRRHTPDANILTLTVGDGITLQAQSGATLGLADVQLDAADSVALESANHVMRVLIDAQVAMDWVKVTVRD
jgi:hypothetical protein